MTPTTRSRSGLLPALSLLSLLAACSLELSVKNQCALATDCSSGNSCSFGQCVPRPALDSGMTPPAAGLPVAQCGSSGTVRRYGSETELRSLLPGQWLFCSGAGVGPNDQVGLELASDHAYVLVRSPNGNLVRGQGSRYEGTLSVTQSAGPLQLSVGWASGETTVLETAYEDGPRRMMVTEGGRISIYTAVSALTPSPAAQCTSGTGVVRPYATASQARALLVGQWLFCSGPALGPTTQLGLEFTSDSRVRVIHSGPSGDTVSGGGFLFEASLELADLTSAEGPPKFQLTLHWSSGSSVVYTLSFEDAPRRLVLTDVAGVRVTYAGLGDWDAGVVGGGAGAGGAGAGGAGAGGAGGMSGTACDVLSGTGCAPGQKCTVMVQGGRTVAACVIKGSRPRGAACGNDSDCDAGTLCGCLGAAGAPPCTCRRFCDPSVPDACGGSGTSCEIGLPNYNDLRLCTDACTLFSNTCQDHSECKVGAGGAQLCSPVGTVTTGGTCRGATLSGECAEGLACDRTSLTCRPMCDAAHPCAAGACSAEGICQGT